jgi:hypothetical protein
VEQIATTNDWPGIMPNDGYSGMGCMSAHLLDGRMSCDAYIRWLKSG